MGTNQEKRHTLPARGCVRTPLALALALAFALPASAQEATTIDTPALTLGRVIVVGHATGPLATRNVLTSVDTLRDDQIADQAVTHNWQLFGQIPGVMLTQFGQGTTSGKFSMRGFNGEGEINAVKLLIDGIPSNSNDGNMPYIDLAPLLDIHAVEVVRGTNDPRYGMHNIAGNANIVTKIGDNYKTARLGYGSFDTRDLQGALGFDANGFSQNYGFDYQSTDGYRNHSSAEKGGFSGKWFWSPDKGTARYGLIVRHHQASADEAGYLTYAQSRQDPDLSPAHNRTDRDHRSTNQVAIQAENQWSGNLFWTAQAYQNDLDDRRYVTFSATVSQQERIVVERHRGASGTLTWRPAATALGSFTVVGGLDTEHQDNSSQRYNTVEQVRTAQTRNQQFDLDTTGGFVQVVYKPSSALTVTPAWRGDKIAGTYTNLLGGQTYGVNDYGLISQPKISAVYKLAPSYSVYGNWGRSFQIGVGTAAYKVNQSADLAPSINEGWETGLKFRPLDWIEGRVALWEQTASNEARRKLNDPANDAENIGATRRRGLDIQLNAQPTEQLGAWVGAAFQRSKIVRTDAASIATLGNEIDHVPHLLYNLGADYKASDRLRFSASMNGQSSYYLERTNKTGKFGGYALLNLSATWCVKDNFDVEVQVRNVANRYYEYVWHDGTQSLHAPGSPRSINLMVTAHF
ncbi:TonB-dependent receptor [Massilia agilis]|uniref:TonB-dependent receptor n=1 Tax=Massilia agilis TaxID=1811226 RepID=A0ABT2DC17_9BURK|nr:TonB-dependent receptor [Massilia agilis]MCS0808384.1 TonB-dependent receptor [Massilia agilis]